MSAVAEVKIEVTVESGDGITARHKSSKRWSPAAALATGKVESVSLTGSAFTALSPPTGAKAVALVLPTSAESLTLKGVTGDTGIVLSPASGFVGCDALIPLGSSPSIGITNGDSTTVVIQAIWL
jgi:hypothetical protein